MRSKWIKGMVSFSLVGAMFAVSAFSQTSIFSNVLSAQKAYAAPALPANAKDGVILHAFDWSFNTVRANLSQIAAAGYKSIQVSPVQGTKNSSTDPSQWWLLYQPTNESVGNSQLGSLADFKALCSEANNYGIKIIVDVVMNHMANNGNADQLDPSVDPSFQDSSLYHNLGQATNWSNRWEITQKGIGMPDLNTQSSAVQGKALTFLNQLADAGAGGFRFDAAKHIETSMGLDANQSWAGNYWTNVLGNVNNRSNLFVYGEILQDGTADNVSAYASFMNVTASNFGGSVRNALSSGNLSSANGMGGLDPAKAVNFVETHDTYEDGTSKNLTDWQRKAGWAIVASRAGATPLFFDRPTGSIGSAGDGQWHDADIVAINEFHNAMSGQNEYLRWTNNNSTMLIDRGTVGSVIVNYGNSTSINSPTNLANGTYSNHGSASATLTVSNGTISGNIPANSIIVLYGNDTTTTPTPTPTAVVSSDPSTAVAGQAVTITYNATGRSLQGSSSMKLHWGYDGWNGTTDTTMTSMGNNTWKATITTPLAAKSALNVVFTNGSTWDNNNSANWSIPVTNSSGSTGSTDNTGTTGTTAYAPHAGYKVDYDSSTLVQGKSFTIYYGGSLVNASQVKLHWGTNGWTGTTDVAMSKRSDGFWATTITIPSSATVLNVDFTDGTNWDNNGSKDWNLNVWSTSNPVLANPAPVAGKQTTITYNGSLAAGATSMTLHWGTNGWVSPADVIMTKQSNGTWTAVITLPSGSNVLNMAFKNNAGTWDSNNSKNFNYSVSQ